MEWKKSVHPYIEHPKRGAGESGCLIARASGAVAMPPRRPKAAAEPEVPLPKRRSNGPVSLLCRTMCTSPVWHTTATLPPTSTLRSKQPPSHRSATCRRLSADVYRPFRLPRVLECVDGDQCGAWWLHHATAVTAHGLCCLLVRLPLLSPALLASSPHRQ